MIEYNQEEQKFINIVDGSIPTHKEIKEHYEKLLAKHKIQDCTPRQWDHCRVEKMGCGGCYYDHGIHSDAKRPHEFNTLRIPEVVDTTKCLHCGTTVAKVGLGVPVYCEMCYQKLLSDYQEQQLKIKRAAEELFKK